MSANDVRMDLVRQCLARRNTLSGPVGMTLEDRVAALEEALVILLTRPVMDSEHADQIVESGARQMLLRPRTPGAPRG